MQLADLIPELLLNVASFLPQVDLLNVSLTCRRLHDVTESELYREYTNPHERLYREYINIHKRQIRFKRSIREFVLRLLDRPDLAKYVSRVEL
jgi:hypothetical protein